MKRILPVLFMLCLMVLFSACGGKEIFYIESCEWEMQAVMKNDAELTDSDEGLVPVTGKPDEFYPDAKIIDLKLTASGGEITVADATNDKTYTGSYKISEETSREISYEIVVDGIAGYAAVSMPEHYDKEKIPTMSMDLGEYSVYFTTNEESMK